MLFTIGIISFGLPDDIDIEIDSMEKNLSDSITLKPIDRTKILNELAYKYRKTDYERSVDYGEQALLLAKENNFEGQELIALKNLGFSYNQLCEYGKAENINNRILEIVNKKNDKIQRSSRHTLIKKKFKRTN